MWARLELAPDLVRLRTLETPEAPPAVEVEVRSSAVPVERELAMMPRAVPVVETPVKEKAVPVASSEVAAISPEEMVRSPSVRVTEPVVRVREAVSAPAPATVMRPVPRNENVGLVLALPKEIFSEELVVLIFI